MFEYELILIAIIPLLFTSIGGYVAFKIVKKQAKTILADVSSELFGAGIDTFINELKTNKELQQAIYFAGQIIGNGAKQGAFSGVKGRGKGGIEQLLIEGLMGFMNKGQGTQPQQTTDTGMGFGE